MFLLLKYLTAPFMVLLIISHGIIQFGIFGFVQTKHRTAMENQIRNGISDSRQIVFKFSKTDYCDNFSQIDWKYENEFRLNDQMYDITGIQESEDSVYLYCVLDSEESDLYSLLDKLITEDSENTEDENGLNSFFSHFYSFTANQNQLENYYSDNQYSDYISGCLPVRELPVITPPPRV